MKAEDTREGMWVRCGIHVVQVVQRNDVLRGYNVRYASGAAAVLPEPTMAMARPWTPRVGEWVQRRCRGPLNSTGPFVVCGVTDRTVHHPVFGWIWTLGLEPCPPPEANPAREMTCEEHLDAIAAEPRTHNAKCPRCGGRAYQGLLNAECIEPVCDDPETREPQVVSEVPHYTSGKQCNDQRGEVVYEARGRGRALRHPTREGAIQAWREAVRRG